MELEKAKFTNLDYFFIYNSSTIKTFIIHIKANKYQKRLTYIGQSHYSSLIYLRKHTILISLSRNSILN